MKAQLAARAAKVEDFLAAWPDTAPDAPDRLKQAMLYSLQAGGKRLRPVICMASAGLFGLDEDKALPFAAAIEMIHTYSLIHDDLPAMDNDDLRRGKPSNHKQFDEATAILAGDALLTDAFWLISRMPLESARVLAALGELAAAAGSGGMAGGQMLDMLYTGKTGIAIEQIARMQALKTGAMLRASAVCGAILAGAPEPEIEAMHQYGAALGRAFQIADDILDLTSSTEVMGKPAGSDVASGKNTYPALLGIAKSREIARAEAEKAIAALPEKPEAAFLAALADYAVSRSA